MPIHCHVEAIVRRMLEMMHMARRIPHYFLGNAAHIDAGATQRSVFDYRYSGAVLGRATRMGYAATATSDDYEVEFFGQVFFSNRASVLIGAPREAAPTIDQRALC